MPTYDYRCEQCGHEMDVFQGITEDALTTCEKCGAESLRRLIGSGAGIIFKGSGFYETDYKRSRSSSSKDDSKSESKPEKKPETKSEAKPKKSDD
jgi:putative FmdB family regulatory protein